MSEALQIKRASERLVKSVGGIEAAASILGKGHSTVGRWVNRNDADYSMPLADARELEANAPEPLITMALARLAGGVFFALPQAIGCDDALPAQVMLLVKELGDVSGAIGAALADGVVTPSEASAALEQLHELDTASAKLRAMLTALAEKGER